MAISPKQAADAAVAAAAAQAANLKVGEKALADVCDNFLEGHLKTHGRAVIGVLSIPRVPNALPIIAFSLAVLEDLEQRYREAGWTTKLDGDVLTIEPPSTPS